jgi:hypothetical protein
METWLEGYEWVSGLKMLSLDFIHPVYGELGVGIRWEETLRGLARDTLRGRHLEGRPLLLKSGQSDDLSEFYSIQVVALLDLLERALGRKSRLKLEHWVQYIACTENHNPWTVYEDLLTSWASIFRKTRKDEIGFSIDPALIAAELRLARDLDGPRELLSQQRKKFLTAWDFALFSELGLLDIPEGSEFFPFVDGILLAIGMAKFQDFWKWLVSFISSDDLEAVAVAVRKRAQDRDITYCDPARLPLGNGA